MPNPGGSEMLDRFKQCLVQADQSLRTGMIAMDESAAEICLVVDGEGRLVGTLTDGDVRRALLTGADLDTPLSPHMERRFVAVAPEAGRAEVIELMQARDIRQIPVLDKDGRVIGLHLMHEMIGRTVKPNWAVIMAGGQGTRLRPITENIPKPMIRVAGRPILERIVLHLMGFGFRKIFISVNYLGHIIEEHFGDGSRFGCSIHYLREDDPLGTGGALALLPECPSHPVLVINGDLVTQVKADELLDYHNRGGFKATIGMRRYLHSVPFGCLSLNKDGEIMCLEEKPFLERWVNAGIYVLSPEVIGCVPKKFYPITELFESLIEAGQRIGAFEILDDWIDVGQKDQLAAARGR